MSELVYIEWIDSVGTRGDWIDQETLDNIGISRIQTFGVLYKETEELVVVYASKSSMNQYEGVMCIPKIAITKREKAQRLLKGGSAGE